MSGCSMLGMFDGLVQTYVLGVSFHCPPSFLLFPTPPPFARVGPQMSKRFYLTTAIDYTNGEPHLGHAYEKIVTDVIARSRRSLGEDVWFLTGLDEHGQKVQQAALDSGKQPGAYCDELAATWMAFAKRLNLSNDDFIRTTQPRHQAVVQSILARLHATGHFYKANYSGFYSLKEETFLTEKDRRPDGSFDPGYGEIVELVEDNYYFKLKDHQPWLTAYLEGNPDFIQPPQRRNEVLGLLKSTELQDLCITRPRARLNWGIPVPFDEHFVTYVWFDALVNYLTAPASRGDATVLAALRDSKPPIEDPPLNLWPADIHIIGKDILKFHAVYSPIMLKAMGLPLPKQILAHGWWQKDGQKMSKTTGNIVDPIAVIDEWGVDAFRYYVVRELDIGPDGNWTDAGFAARYQAELAAGLGHLVNRSLSMLKRYRNGAVPALHSELAPDAERAIAETRSLLEQNELQRALQSIGGRVPRGNQYGDQTRPFALAKNPANAARLDEVLYNLAEVCRILAVLVWPFLPGTAGRIFCQLALTEAPDKFIQAKWGGLKPGDSIGTPQALLDR